jgi:hypothetical protein
MKIRLQNVRLAFPALFEAKTVNGEGKPTFSASFILPADHPQIAEINEAIDAVAKDKWGAKAPNILKELRAKDKVALHDGDTKSQYDGFEGNMYVSARSEQRPLVLDRDKTPLTEADGKPYAGSYVYATVELWAQDNGYGKRVNAQLKGVQFFRDGDAFAGGGAPADPDDFDDLGEGVDAADTLA